VRGLHRSLAGAALAALLGASLARAESVTAHPRQGPSAASEHLAAGETQPPEAPRAAPRSLADELQDLRREVSALAERPQPASAAEVGRVLGELERLSAAERDLARRFDERFVGAPAPADAAPEWSFWGMVGLLGVGATIGFFADRVLLRRRESRQRGRLRL
jgi:hypothetical protein